MIGTTPRRGFVASIAMVIVLSTLGLCTMAAPSASAATLSVFNGGSIQNAIVAANNGDTVRVYPGTYLENLDFLGKAITVLAVAGPGQTTIDGRGLAPVVRFTRNEPRAATLQGFTVKNGFDPFEGGGVQISTGSPTITNNVITANHSCSGSGLSAASSSALIASNTISANTQQGCSGGAGGGIYVRAAGATEIRGNTITGNRAETGGGIDLFAAGQPVLMNNHVSGNKATTHDGGGISIVNVSDATIVQNLFVGNAANFGAGGGAAWFVPAGARGPVFVNNTLASNNASVGHALFAEGFQVNAVVSNNLFTATNGPAVVCGNFAAQLPQFRANDVWAPNAGWDVSCGIQNNVNGNRSVNPLFVNAAAGDLHLAVGSPAIDAGIPAAGLPATDLDGLVRVRDGDGNGVATVDLGVFER